MYTYTVHNIDAGGKIPAESVYIIAIAIKLTIETAAVLEWKTYAALRPI